METRTTVTDTIWYTSVISTYRAGIVSYDVVKQDCAEGGAVWMENLKYADGGTYDELNTDATDFLKWLSISIGPLTILSFFQVSEKLSSEFLGSGTKSCRFTGPVTDVCPLGEPDPNFGQKYRKYRITNTRTISGPVFLSFQFGKNAHPFSKVIVLEGPCCPRNPG